MVEGYPHTGLPPHMWGIFSESSFSVGLVRVTPTHVGNILYQLVQNPCQINIIKVDHFTKFEKFV